MLNYVTDVAKKEFFIIDMIMKMKRNAGHNIYIFGAPFHSNMGDQAQTYCIKKWVETNYPNSEIWVLDTWLLTFHDYQLLRMIAKIIHPNDRIFLHSGYHTTDLYMLEENMQRKVVELFPLHKIVFLPQTILYKSETEQHRSQRIYNAHKNMIMMCRDDVSYTTAEKLFPKCRLLKYPDIVTSEIGQHFYAHKRDGILLCMRNDKEAFYSSDQISDLMKSLSQYGRVDLSDTTIDVDAKEISKNRKQILEDMWDQYAKYRLIITDRYHGTIFSLIANTPVLVLSSTDHKLSSGVKWFPEEFSDYVRYVPDLEALSDNVKRVFDTQYTYKLPAYFKVNYYDKLKSLID